MAVSRRLRYEVLLRDNHTCRYCGATAPDVKLTVDHVLPVALGGGDEPSNLAAACSECNGGKSASTPGAPTVAAVAADADRWAAALKEAARRRAERAERTKKWSEVFAKWWEQHTGQRHDLWCRCDGRHVDCAFALPLDWRYTLEEMRVAGLESRDLVQAVSHTFSRDFYVRSRWRYFCGTAWGLLKAHQEEAASLLADGPPHAWRNSMDGTP